MSAGGEAMTGSQPAMSVLQEYAWKKYRDRYLELTRRYDALVEQYNCGNTLAEHISPEAGIIRREIAAIEDATKELMKQ